MVIVMSLKQLNEYIKSSKLGQSIKDSATQIDELTITTTPDNIAELLMFLRDDKKCMFKQLLSICGVDYPEKEKRFEVIYNLLSLEHNQRIRVKVNADTQTLIPTVTNIFASASWYEREIWDMYGILFANHPDLRRILTDYVFEGHPLRKDFPLTGHLEVRYDIERKQVVYEPVTLTQEFRNFDFTSPWEGVNYVLPGDEKATKE